MPSSEHKSLRVNTIDFRAGPGKEGKETTAQELEIEAVRLAIRNLLEQYLALHAQPIKTDKIKSASERLAGLMTVSLTEWLKDRYGEGTNPQGNDIIRKTAKIELLPKNNLKLETNFWICGQRINFTFDINGILQETNAPDPATEQAKISKQLLTPTRHTLISDHIKDHLKGLGLLKSREDTIAIVSNNRLILLKDLYSGYIPSHLLKITQRSSSEGIIGYHISVNGYIITNPSQSSSGTMLVFNKEGKLVELIQEQLDPKKTDFKNGIIQHAPLHV
ncbi:MAG: hypothetical protein WC269_01345 [Candidatus Gracilibacteria bacterium]|jgi:hypothetical protein